MSAYIDAIDGYGRTQPDVCAFFNSAGESITYGQLLSRSNELASLLGNQGLASLSAGAPIAVYGHKSPLMLVAFLACVKTGHAYVPLDVTLPKQRIASIIGQLDNPLLIDTTGKAADSALDGAFESVSSIIDISSLEWTDDPSFAAKDTHDACVAGDDTFYILFTSGSTGAPKGVEITAGNVDAFCGWMCDAFAGEGRQVFFNRAPFTFDLSVTDLVRGLGGGDTLFALEEQTEASLRSTFDALAKSGVTFWVSTPSFADMCLADPAFGAAMLPDVRTFFFVGETLRNETALLLLERFPEATVVNGYGPTESTVLITATAISEDMARSPEPLPVGYPRPNSELYVLDPDSLEEVPQGESGELFIVGDTVAKGYFKRQDATQAAFASYPKPVPDGMRAYRTGDRCSLDPDGMLRFYGRYDFQVKLHGYRIELGDIEANICALDQVRQTCVIPVVKNGSPSYLQAFCQLEEGVESSFATTRELKDSLGKRLPAYMVPRTFTYLDAYPLTNNGKIDRKALAEMAGSE